MQKKLQLLLALLTFVVTSAMAQITTSGISGKISSNGETVIGATVTAIHQPSGTMYRAVTNIDGRYTIQGMRPGGPYKVSISYIGYKDKVFNNVSLNLGKTRISLALFRKMPSSFRRLLFRVRRVLLLPVQVLPPV